MTGYGRRQVSEDGREVTCEVKSVNHRFLDIAFRMPRNLSFLEEPVRKALSGKVSRGHVDVFITYRNLREDAKEAIMDKALVKAYQSALDDAAKAMGIENNLTMREYALLPDVISVSEREEDKEAVIALTLKALNMALDDLTAMRKREGEALASDLTEHLNALVGFKQRIAKKAPQVPILYRDKLTQRLAEISAAGVDPQRIAQEVALFADKCAIDEELSRLDSHIAQMHECLRQKGEVGRKLDFLVQELNREVNTIGSKASDADITLDVVAAKSAIEKLREQVQNVE